MRLSIITSGCLFRCGVLEYVVWRTEVRFKSDRFGFCVGWVVSQESLEVERDFVPATANLPHTEWQVNDCQVDTSLVDDNFPTPEAATKRESDRLACNERHEPPTKPLTKQGDVGKRN